ncbi:protein-L-isoaspartate(D-aspartate) O-methyltransferase [Candidatus Cardinium hertigii]|uniref:Protein-L-isoaspartate O-methyltransferase n=1 Tax=Candidatus Cardinium hertigii TaxID=247481 RepID=A0A2Z3L9X4_9BACT|nr:protein-L-isoaspartate(D-aspartate) O-methyltransferase [Candidatus Cardinium hertigii]AWN82298.1 Protein-L-isoaspartate O-methyltransferase [Candidatus Cardinium hertigii]
MQADNGYTAARLQMVKTQIEARGIRDENVLHAMENVPRHLFVPKALQPYAYTDSPLAIGYGQTISQPYIVAFMTEALRLPPKAKVLEIGTGSGYQAALLSQLSSTVYTIEIIKNLNKKALFKKLGYTNIHTKIDNGYKGWAAAAPFDAIILTAASPHIIASLLHQVNIGGTLLCH